MIHHENVAKLYDTLKGFLPQEVKYIVKTALKFLFYPLLWTNRKIVYHKAKRNPQKRTAKVFYDTFGRHIDYDNPVDINEKIHWLKFYSDTTNWSKLADKYLVRDYVKSKGLGHTLNELYAVYETEKDIDISDLPENFVLKLNNGCADILIVKDKTEITNKQVIKYFKNFREYGVLFGEYHYLDIKRCIIAEKLLVDNNSETDFLVDYKFWCFNGEPLYIYVAYDRTKEGHSREIYTSDWKLLKDAFINSSVNRIIPKPKSFEKMKEMCRLLASDIPLVRVDWYEINGNPVFGEMTLTPGAGLHDDITKEFAGELGSHLKLPQKQKLYEN